MNVALIAIGAIVASSAVTVVFCCLVVAKRADEAMADIERADDWSRWEHEVRS